MAQTDHQVDRVVYIDDPIPKTPSLATKAFVRNLNSSSVQQHMLWDSESLYSQRTDSDLYVIVFVNQSLTDSLPFQRVQVQYSSRTASKALYE